MGSHSYKGYIPTYRGYNPVAMIFFATPTALPRSGGKGLLPPPALNMPIPWFVSNANVFSLPHTCVGFDI